LIAESEADRRFQRILIVRLGAMGDVIHTLPAVQALRDAFPRAMIGWLIEERWAELLCASGAPRRGPRSRQRPLVDWVHTVDLRGWKKSLFTLTTAQQVARVWNDVRSARYDIAVDLQGAIRSALLARWSGARAVWGAAESWETPASLWYTRSVVAQGKHVIERNLSIAEAVAQTKLTTPVVQFPRDHTAEAHTAQMLAEAGMCDFVVLNPGAGWGAKRWPAERYGMVAKSLATEGLRSIINFGPGEEDLVRVAQSASAGMAVPLNSSLTELIALIRRAKLFIGGDTGPLHLAAALRKPVVAIFGPTDPARNGPFGTRSVALRNPASRTTHARHRQPEEGLLAVTVEHVVSSARQLLRDSTEKGHG